MVIDFSNRENVGLKGEHITLLPKEMKPSKEAFESCGFVFEDIGHRVFYKVVSFPDGWTMRGNELYDADGSWRAYCQVHSNMNYQDGKMGLCTRFYFSSESLVEDDFCGPCNLVVRDRKNLEKNIFCKGTYTSNLSEEYQALKEEAIAFMNENYPDWEDPLKYWD